MADHPLTKFYSDRILVIGDAAHASTPHHGSGAGFCMEDVAVFASLLEEIQEDNINPIDGLRAAFAAFDASRRDRDQWLVRSSRRAADLYEWRLPNTGKENFEAVRKDIETRQAICWGVDLERMIQEARADLRRIRNAPE
jgi:salicylate hydroxylase